MKFLKGILTAALLPLALLSCGRKGLEGEGVNTAFLDMLQPRDSVLIADQVRYGVRLYGLPDGTRLTMLPAAEFSDSLLRVRDWGVDTLASADGRSDLSLAVTLTAFDEGEYLLPALSVERWFSDGVVDTLHFDEMYLTVHTMPVDTATFQLHPLKPQASYPLSVADILPWAGVALGAAALVLLVLFLVRRSRRRVQEEILRQEPAHITALRKLDALRKEKYGEPEHQKAYYSAVTDILREYMSRRWDVDALEKTTGELFPLLAGRDIPKDLLEELRQLFELSDFVKFARLHVTPQEASEALPLAVRFVTETYREELQQDKPAGAQEGEGA